MTDKELLQLYAENAAPICGWPCGKRWRPSMKRRNWSSRSALDRLHAIFARLRTEDVARQFGLRGLIPDRAVWDMARARKKEKTDA